MNINEVPYIAIGNDEIDDISIQLSTNPGKISNKVVIKAVSYSNLSQYVQNEVMNYALNINKSDIVFEVADRIIKRVQEDMELINGDKIENTWGAGIKAGREQVIEEIINALPKTKTSELMKLGLKI